MTGPIKVGDLVRLRAGGGQVMRVIETEETSGETGVLCEWADTSQPVHVRREKRFAVSSVEKIDTRKRPVIKHLF